MNDCGIKQVKVTTNLPKKSLSRLEKKNEDEHWDDGL